MILCTVALQVCPEYLGFFGVPHGADATEAELILEAPRMQGVEEGSESVTKCNEPSND